jgi:luciferase family oxidoreductase group 1
MAVPREIRATIEGMIPFSILDLSPIPEGASAGDALRNTLDLARHAEGLGFRRFWLAEHHNMPGIASAATAVAIGYVAGGTTTIRVGSGGVMLPNHAPLVVAEQFGTLASLYPDRIDLGLGRAPGTDPVTTRALRRHLAQSVETFPGDVQELQGYFEPAEPGQQVRALPGAGLRVPLWLLGSTLFSANLAAALGLPFAFACHFAPDDLAGAVEVYRARFEPSAQLSRPYVMLAVNVCAASTDAAARRLFTSQQQAWANLRRGRPGPLPPPIDDIEEYWTPAEREWALHAMQYSFVGSAEAVRRGLERFLAAHRPEELMTTAHLFDQAARRRSIELVARVREDLRAATVLAGTDPAPGMVGDKIRVTT